MRTSLIEIEQIEQHLLGSKAPGDMLVFEAQQLLKPEMRERVALQRETYQFVNRYGRKQLRMEIETVHQKLFNQQQHQSFRQKILAIFSNR